MSKKKLLQDNVPIFNQPVDDPSTAKSIKRLSKGGEFEILEVTTYKGTQWLKIQTKSGTIAYMLGSTKVEQEILAKDTSQNLGYGCLTIIGIIFIIFISWKGCSWGYDSLFNRSKVSDSDAVSIATNAIENSLSSPLIPSSMPYHSWEFRSYYAKIYTFKFIGTNAFGGQVKGRAWVVVYRNKTNKKLEANVIDLYNDTGLPDSVEESEDNVKVYTGRANSILDEYCLKKPK
jgi:hypothetical protein